MNRGDELAIGDRIVRLAATPPADHHGAAVNGTEPSLTIDARVYTDPARHAAERALLGEHPTLVAHSSDVPAPGDFITAELWGTPIVVARDAHGVHAYVNACVHRGATVVTEPCGHARLHSCPFHGWSYELDGSLRSISEPDRFGEPSGLPGGLRRLACEERHGSIWVVGDPTVERIDVAEWLTPSLDGLLTDLELASMTCHRSQTYELACNWKMITDGFLETYHLKYLHRASIAPYFPSNRIDCRRHGPHFTTFLPKNRLLAQLAERPRDDWDVLAHLTMSTTLVPGTVIQWQAGHVELFSLRPHPTDPSRCAVRMTMLVPTARAGDTDLWDRNWQRLADTIPAEDFVAAEDVQRNIAAGAVTRLTLGATERHLAEHLSEIDRRL